MNLLRFSTMGSVDDGKSTLIGRLLYESKGIYQDQLRSVQKASKLAGATDFSLVTDGLRAEREQGITIDVAYRHFATPRRRFVIADTPGHEQYTRNMATGASTADLALILIDARNGVLPQSRRHAFIANVLGIRQFVVAINKMDLVGYSQSVYQEIAAEFAAFLERIGVPPAVFIPVVATNGDNVVERSANMPWYAGPCLLDYLENVTTGDDLVDRPVRLPIQLVIRPPVGGRLYAGQLAAGRLARGDDVLILPSRRQSRIAEIVTWHSDLDRAVAPQSVSVALTDDLDAGRGDMLVHPASAPHVSRHLRAQCVWMNQKALQPGVSCLIKHTTHQMRCVVRAIHHLVNLIDLTLVAVPCLNLNDIGEISIETHRPIFFDSYRENRITGAAILIDPVTNETVGACTILHVEGSDETRGHVTEAERRTRYGHPGRIIAVDGRETAQLLERELFDRGMVAGVFEDAASANAAAAAGIVAIHVGTDVAELSVAEIVASLTFRRDD